MSRPLPIGFLLGLLILPVRGDDLAKELPRIPPTEPDAALKTFRIKAGFQLIPVAVEPLVTDPVAACFDADGRLYVVEMRGYPYPEEVPSGNVRLLEDEDDDGKFDRSTIFVDGLSWPTSVVPYDGGVFIAVAPDILYAKDTDGDGRADVKKTMFTGFGTQNVQALVNGLLWGPDGWIYGVGGGNGGEIKNLTISHAKAVNIRGRDFRFKPDGSAFEAASGGGQFGHSFDDWGHRFTCNNSNHIRQIVLPADALARNPHYTPPAVLIDIAVEGGAGPVFRISPPEPWRVVRTRQRLADPKVAERLAPTEKHVIGFFTSATGVTIYRGTAYPPEYRGNAFIGDVGGNLVHRKILSKDGAIFKAKRADENVEFLASTDNWFRPVNFLNTPDGTLLVLDMYRETIEHPASIPEPIKKHLDLTSGHDRGRIYHLVPDGFRKRKKPALSTAKTEELVALLAAPDAWWRETAQRLLIERNDPAAVPWLRDLARFSPGALGKVHALWTLDALGQLRGLDVWVVLKTDLLEAHEPAARFLGKVTLDEEAIAEVRKHYAELLGEEAARDFVDRNALIPAFLANHDPMVRFQVALGLGRVSGRQMPAVASLAAVALRALDDPWTRAAVLCSSAGRAERLIRVLAGRAREEGGLRKALRPWFEDLAAVIGAENRPDGVRQVLNQAAEFADDPATARALVLGLGRGLSRSGGSLRAVLAGRAGETIAPVFDRAAREAVAEGSALARLEAIRLLGLGPIERAVEVLPPLLDARQPASVQLAALQALGDVPDPRVASAILERWKGLGPTVRREAVETMLSRTGRVAALLDAIESKLVSAADLDPARRQQLLAHPDKALRARAAKLIGKEAKSDRTPVIASFRKALELDGDTTRGQEVFRKHCATCHKAEGQGTEVGPDLATVTNRTPEDLLVHVLDPNREVAPTYVNYTIATDDGRVLTGLIAAETADAVTLKRAEGAADVVPRGRIDAMASTGLSLMPEGLEKEIPPQAMADLLAYLQRLRAPSSR